MRYKIRYSPLAQNDLDTVWDEVWLASKSYDTADNYITEFTGKIAEKKRFPKSGIPLYYRGLFTGFYSVNFKKYKAFYRIRENYIEVARVILARRDFMKVLFGESMDANDKHENLI
ncbi:MAG: type II toxin-antitoxin system RelE/ParE family toxin [Treponema sp.]|nr:type II toxin-antitoxin system RelE/ParE family toxin [Treponema sp.]